MNGRRFKQVCHALRPIRRQRTNAGLTTFSGCGVMWSVLQPSARPKGTAALRDALLAGVAAASLLISAACGGPEGKNPPPPASAVDSAAAAPPAHADPPRGLRGGELVFSIRSEPRSFNILMRRDATTYLLGLLMHARLVRVNAATQQVEPWLAESYTRLDDGRRYRLRLRPNLKFSDGVPLTPDDVLFSLDAAYSPGSVVASVLQPGGAPMRGVVVDDRTVDLIFSAPYGPELRLLDNLAILPAHMLRGALAAGRLPQALGVTTPPGQLVGAGPFVIQEYVPGQRLVFARNPHYFRTLADAGGADSGPLPLLDRLVANVVPDQEQDMVRVLAGQSDTTNSEVRPEDYGPLGQAARQGRVALRDLGVAQDPDAFWINLTPGAFAGDPRAAWLQREELRQAISLAVNRQAFADSVYLGSGSPVWGPVTETNRIWYSDSVPHPGHDPAAARRLLASIGLTDGDGDGRLADSAGRPARFTLLTARGQSSLERGAAAIRDDLAKIGLTVDVVALEGNALIETFLSRRGYDAVYFHLTTTDTDPAGQSDFWLSTGDAHVWNLPGETISAQGSDPNAANSAQGSDPKGAKTAWEAEIDRLMAQQATTLDLAERQRLFAEVQRTFAAHLPMIHFAAPHVLVVSSSRLTNLMPALTRPQLLWSADTLAVIK